MCAELRHVGLRSWLLSLTPSIMSSLSSMDEAFAALFMKDVVWDEDEDHDENEEEEEEQEEELGDEKDSFKKEDVLEDKDEQDEVKEEEDEQDEGLFKDSKVLNLIRVWD